MTLALLRFGAPNCVLVRVLLVGQTMRKLAKKLEKRKRNGDSGTTRIIIPIDISPMRGKISLKSQIKLNDNSDISGFKHVYYLCTTYLLSLLLLKALSHQKSLKISKIEHQKDHQLSVGGRAMSTIEEIKKAKKLIEKLNQQLAQKGSDDDEVKVIRRKIARQKELLAVYGGV